MLLLLLLRATAAMTWQRPGEHRDVRGWASSKVVTRDVSFHPAQAIQKSASQVPAAVVLLLCRLRRRPSRLEEDTVCPALHPLLGTSVEDTIAFNLLVVIRPPRLRH